MFLLHILTALARAQLLPPISVCVLILTFLLLIMRLSCFLEAFQINYLQLQIFIINSFKPKVNNINLVSFTIPIYISFQSKIKDRQLMIVINNLILKRMFAYNHPLLTQGAGRIKTDPINDERIDTILDRFQQYAKANSIPLSYNIDGVQASRSKIAFPIAGFAIGVISSITFVRPGSRYIGKCFTLFTTYLGYKLHERYQQAYNSSRYFGNFGNYPADIQRMIDNNDARYAYKWLQDDFMEIEPSLKKKVSVEEDLQIQD